MATKAEGGLTNFPTTLVLYLENFMLVQLQAKYIARDANSPAISIPRGFGESGYGNLSFLGDRGN